MKKKILFLVGGVVLGGLFSLNVSAQTDVTSTYVKDADFASIDGWTQVHPEKYWALGNGLIGTYAVVNDKTSTTDETHLATEYCLGMQCRWETNYANFTQAIPSLPAGVYTLSYDVENTNASTTSATYANNFSVKVGETTYTDSKKEWMNGNTGWTAHAITFTLTETAEATISLGYGTGSNNIGSSNTPHLYVSHLKLTWSDPLVAAKAALQEEIDKAKLCDAKEGLADAIAAAENALSTATTEAELTAALVALQEADKDALLRYENGLADAKATAGIVTSFVVNGTFDSDASGWTATGAFQNKGTATNQQGDFTVPFWENWNGSALVNKMYQTVTNIPNGTYKLKIAAFVNTLADPNESQFVFAGTDKVYLTTGSPTFYEVWTVVTTNAVEIGLEQTTATANWMGIDNVSLTYYGAGDVREAAQAAGHKIDWDEALAAAKAALANDDYKNVVGEEKTALEAEIAKAEPTTAAGYDAATEALNNARKAFTDAKASYDGLATANAYVTSVGTLAYADAAKKPAVSAAATSAADAVSKTAAVMTAVRAYYESHAAAEGVATAVDKTSAIVNATDPSNNDGWTWSGNKNNPANNEPWTDADGTNTHSYFDGGNWGASAWTTSMKQTVSLPAGKYLLTAKARAASNVTFKMSVGEVSVDLPHVGSTGNVFDRGWGDASLEFETEGEDVEIVVVASTETVHEWFSVSDFRLVQLEEIVVPMATAEDYTALANAISAAEAKTLGFGAGEYAPYKNVEALKALAAAKAIDPDAAEGNTQKNVKAATTALTAAEWVSNTADVDAIYNGLFATVAEGANYPDGWARTNSWGQMRSEIEGDYATAYYNQPGSLVYGGTGFYTMPLAANTYYMIMLVYRSHEDNSNNGITVTVQKGEDVVVEKVLSGNPSKTEWKKGVVGFKTGAAGNHVLKLANSGNTWMTAVSLMKATPETVDLTVTDVQYATFIAPFDVTVPTGVTASKVTGVDDTNELVLESVGATIPANTPVLLYSESAVNTTAEGVNEATEATYTKGLLTGVYTDTEAAAGTYVLQKHDSSVAFYLVGDVKPTVGAGRCYLTAPTSGAPVLRLGGTTNIAPVEAETMTAVYDLQGRRVETPAKGIYIVNGKKVLVK